MLGTVIGDIVGSRFEFHNIKTKKFYFFHDDCFFTDDTVISLAIAEAFVLFNRGKPCNVIDTMKKMGKKYPNLSYGNMFENWLHLENSVSYNSFGNGAAMRVSPCGFVATNLDEVKLLSRRVTEVTHNHPEGVKGAESVAVCIYLAKRGETKEAIKNHIRKNYYEIDFTLDEIRKGYTFNETCQGTVPQAIVAFLESNGFEDAIRNGVSIGGDSDTICAIIGGIAEAFYGIPDGFRKEAYRKLDKNLISILEDFEKIADA